jgi:hypothetical protein
VRRLNARRVSAGFLLAVFAVAIILPWNDRGSEGDASGFFLAILLVAVGAFFVGALSRTPFIAAPVYAAAAAATFVFGSALDQSLGIRGVSWDYTGDSSRLLDSGGAVLIVAAVLGILAAPLGLALGLAGWGTSRLGRKVFGART